MNESTSDMNGTTNVNQPDAQGDESKIERIPGNGQNPGQTGEIDPIERRLLRSAGGREAHNRGKLAGDLVARAARLDRVWPNSNLHSISGQQVRIHTISNGTMSFSINPATEPARLIVALGETKPQTGRPVRYRLYGALLTDCIRAGTAPKSSTTKRLTVALSAIRLIRLGEAHLSLQYIQAATVADRLDLLDEIEALSPEVLATIMNDATVKKVRAFVLAGNKQPVSATDPPAAAIEETAAEAVPAVVPAIEEPIVAAIDLLAPLPADEVVQAMVTEGAQLAATGPTACPAEGEQPAEIDPLANIEEELHLETTAVSTILPIEELASLIIADPLSSPPSELVAPAAEQTLAQSDIEVDLEQAANEAAV